MALFSNEPEKNVRPEPSVKPQASAAQAVSAPSPAAERGVERPGPAAPAGACAYLDRSARVSGKLSFDGLARIDGQVDGEIKGKEIEIGESAVVSAQITAASIIIAGTVKGEVSASHRIEIRASARVSGTIAAPKVAMHEGAVFDGTCAMQAEGTREERKLAVHRKGENMVAQVNGPVPAP